MSTIISLVLPRVVEEMNEIMHGTILVHGGHSKHGSSYTQPVTHQACWRALKSTKYLACPLQKHQHHEIQRTDPGTVANCCLVANSCWTLCNPLDYIAHQTFLSMGFPRQEYWSGLPFPSPGDLPDPGIKPTSPTLAGGFFTVERPG